GLSIFGAILGGFLGSYIYIRRNKLRLPAWLDIAAIVLPLGQAIGRWANFVNEELYGIPTGSSFGLQIANPPAPYNGIEYYGQGFHPMFLYESIWSFVAFLVLIWLFNNRRNNFRVGEFALLYVIQYAVIRYALEFLRIDLTLTAGINVSQAVCAISFVVALGLLVLNRRNALPAGYKYDDAMPDPVTVRGSNKKKEETVAETPKNA
ncbi:MAG TPA: prolipoprotein diacylglyceryl transferase, partial [Aggregatilineales bacterium]|nr:prolipoprotein diacylglyceryl transferase [Aggregatilineales bacterium]